MHKHVLRPAQLKHWKIEEKYIDFMKTLLEEKYSFGIIVV